MVIVAKAQEVDTQSSAATLRKSALMSEKGKGIGFIVAAVLFIRDRVLIRLDIIDDSNKQILEDGCTTYERPNPKRKRKQDVEP